MIDKEYKRKIFNKSAKSYDDYSDLQDKVSKNLFKRLDLLKVNPDLILDLGCGTGTNGNILKNKYKNIRLVNYDFSENMLIEARKKQTTISDKFLSENLSFICGDIEDLVFVDSIFDIIWSTNSLQWCNDIEKTFKMVRSILKPGGLFIFSTFGPKTLHELRSITQKITHYKKTNDFLEEDFIKDKLIQESFVNLVIDSEELKVSYQDINKLLLDIKNIGATSGNKNRSKGLTGRQFFKKIEYNYDEYIIDGLYPATYEIIYGYAWKI